jgi:N-terminal domain of anti-restriction factor ArdC
VTFTAASPVGCHDQGLRLPLWLTFKQAIELGGHVRKGEAGELVVYADRITRTETDAKGGETEREIPFTDNERRAPQAGARSCCRRVFPAIKITPPRPVVLDHHRVQAQKIRTMDPLSYFRPAGWPAAGASLFIAL